MKKKMKEVSTANTIAYTSLAITLISVLWNVFYGYGRLAEKMDAMQEDIKEIKVNMDKMDEKMERGFYDVRQDLHKMDIRVTTLEHRKP